MFLESKQYLEKISKNINKDGTKTEKKKAKKSKTDSANKTSDSNLKKKLRAQTERALENQISKMIPIHGNLNYSNFFQEIVFLTKSDYMHSFFYKYSIEIEAFMSGMEMSINVNKNINYYKIFVQHII